MVYCQCYLALNDASTIKRVVTAIGQLPLRSALLVAVNFNLNLVATEGSPCIEYIAVAIATAGLEEIYTHFLLRRKSWEQGGHTWCMCCCGTEVRFWTDYILGTDLRLFQNVSVWDLWHNSDHYMVLGCLHGAPQWYHFRYLGHRRKFPLRPM